MVSGAPVSSSSQRARRGKESTAVARPAASRKQTTEDDTAEGFLSIGELARRTNVSTRTIRYYEELGILPPPERTPGGTRRYPREYIFYVEGARALKDLGFGLEEIAELGKFALTGATTSNRTRAILQEKLAELEHRIRILNRLHDLVVQASAGEESGDGSVTALLHWIGKGSSQQHVGG